MGEFRFSLTSTFDVAFHHGHSALRLLRIASDVESEYEQVRGEREAVPYGEGDYLRLSGRAHFLGFDMFRVAAASVMMFQAMMEAVINDSIESEAVLLQAKKEKKFVRKWRVSLGVVGRTSTAFDNYNQRIYRKYRIPFVHPSRRSLRGFDDLSTAELLLGFREGWRAFEALYEGLGHPHSQGSWQTMCDTYGLPNAQAA